MIKKTKKDFLSSGENQGKNKNLIALSKWNRYHDFPTVGALRNLIFFSEKNGIEKCVRKIGGRLYIEESAFFEWVEERSREEMRGGDFNG